MTTVSSWDDLKALRQRWYTWADYLEELLRSVFTTDALSKEFRASMHAIYAIGGQPDLREDLEETKAISERTSDDSTRY